MLSKIALGGLKTKINRIEQMFIETNKDNLDAVQEIESVVAEFQSTLVGYEQQIDAENAKINNNPVVKTWLQNSPALDEQNNTTDEYTKEVITYLGSIFNSGNDNEINSYVVGQTIKNSVGQLLSQCKQDLEGKTHDQKQQLYMDYSKKLKQLSPDNIHQRIHQNQLSKRARLFALSTLKAGEEKLESLFRSDEGVPEFSSRVSDPVRQERAEVLLKTPEIRAQLLSLISSVKEDHEGVENEIVKRIYDQR